MRNSHRRSNVLLFLSAWILSTCLINPQASRAALIRVYDTDTLVFLARYVVEAHIIGPAHSRPNFDGDDVKITAVYKGDFKVGDVCIVAGLREYNKSWNMRGGAPPGLGAGDDVFLFMHQYSNPMQPGSDDNALEPISSGVRWINHNQVIAFDQVMDPGPLVAQTGGFAQTVAPPSLDKFRIALKQKIIDMADLHRRLGAPLDAKERPWLLHALAERSSSDPKSRGYEYFGMDTVQSVIGRRIGQYHDPDFAYQALSIDQFAPVEMGFASPQGREFLLSKLAAPDTPPAIRPLLVGMIVRAGLNYQSAADANNRVNPWTPYAPHNAGYVARVVKTAIARPDDHDLWKAFAGSMPEIMPLEQSTIDDQLAADCEDAIEDLTRFYKNGCTERQRYDIESFFARISKAQYDSLGVKEFPVDAIAEPDSTNYGDTPSAPFVAVECEYFRLSWIDDDDDADDAPRRTQTVARSETTGKEWNLEAPPAAAPIRDYGIEGSFGDGRQALPKNLRPGRYFIFVRFFHGDKIVGESHGFEIDETGKLAPPTTRPSAN